MLFELLINGLVQGSLLALICVGYSLAYGSAKVINFPHADILITGGGYLVLLWIAGNKSAPLASAGMAFLFGISSIIFFWPWIKSVNKSLWKNRLISLTIGLIVFMCTLYFAGKLPFLLAAIIAIPWTAILATAVYRVGYLRLLKQGAPRTSILLAALGFVIAIESILLIFWGSPRKVFPSKFIPQWLNVTPLYGDTNIWVAITRHGLIPIDENITIPVYDIVIILVFAIIALSLIFFFQFSRIADAIVGAADSRLAARACGISVDKILGYSFFIGGTIASLGGTLYILRAKSLDPTSGFSLGILAFVACVMGGIGSLRGSILGAFLVSMVISFAPAIPLHQWAIQCLPASWNKWLPSFNLNDWSYGVVYLLMIIVILIKPKGLFSR